MQFKVLVFNVSGSCLLCSLLLIGGSKGDINLEFVCSNDLSPGIPT